MHCKGREHARAWVALFAAVACASTVFAATTEWPGWQGPNRDGKSPDTGLLKEWPADGPKLLWKTADIGCGYSNVVVSGGSIYVTGDADKLLFVYAFDMDGKLRWKSDLDLGWNFQLKMNKLQFTGSRSTPALDGDRLYLLSANGRVGCFETKTGKRLWTREASEFSGEYGERGYAESVLILGNNVIFTPGGKNAMAALDKLTGKTVWVSSGFSGMAQYCSPISFTFGDVPLIVNGSKSGLFAVDARDGKALWTNDFCKNNDSNCPTPAYADGCVFWANGYGAGGVCLKLAKSGEGVSAAEMWRTKDMNCHHGGYIVDHGYVYGNHGDGWACVDLKDGAKKWFDKGVGKGSLCWADGMLYLYGEKDGQAALATCSPNGLEIKGRVKVAGKGSSWAHPVVIGGRLYLRHGANLYCYDVKAK